MCLFASISFFFGFCNKMFASYVYSNVINPAKHTHDNGTGSRLLTYSDDQERR